eukprot:jgi/Mesen1/4305/ME000022S03594
MARTSLGVREAGAAVVTRWTRHYFHGKANHGPIHVTVCGNRTKAGLVTYHDVGLNHMTCFQGLFMCTDFSSILLHNFCIYHIDAPGHEAEAVELPWDHPDMSAEDLADQAAEVVRHFGLQDVYCLGVSAGAYILTLLAIKHPSLVAGLILVSPVCQPATWTEWCETKVAESLLWMYGMTRHVKDFLLQRFFCPEQSGFHGPVSDAVRDFRRGLDDRVAGNVGRYLSAMAGRGDLSERLHEVQCETLILVGEKSPFHADSVVMRDRMRRGLTSWREIEACGSLVTEERPHTMQGPLEHYLLGLGFSRPPPESMAEYRSPSLSPQGSQHFSPELMSPQALGIKLKPIRTRIEIQPEDFHEVEERVHKLRTELNRC